MRGFAVPNNPKAGLPCHASRSIPNLRQRATLTNKTRESRSTAKIPDVSESRIFVNGESFIGSRGWRPSPGSLRFAHTELTDRMACSDSPALPILSPFLLRVLALLPLGRSQEWIGFPDLLS